MLRARAPLRYRHPRRRRVEGPLKSGGGFGDGRFPSGTQAVYADFQTGLRLLEQLAQRVEVHRLHQVLLEAGVARALPRVVAVRAGDRNETHVVEA